MDPALIAALLAIEGPLIGAWAAIRGHRVSQQTTTLQVDVSKAAMAVTIEEAVTRRMAEYREQVADRIEQSHQIATNALALVEPLQDHLTTLQAEQAEMKAEVIANRALLTEQRGQLDTLGKEHAQCLRLLGEREAAEAELRAELAGVKAHLHAAGSLLAEHDAEPAEDPRRG